MMEESIYKPFDSTNPYKDSRTMEERKQETDRIRVKYPTKIPVIVQKHYNEKYLQDIDRCKYLVHMEMSICDLNRVICQG